MKINKDELKKIIKEELDKMKDSEFDRESEKIKKDWGGETEPVEEFDAEEFFGDAGNSAEEDIKDEFGDEEFPSFGSLEEPDMLKDLEENGEVGQKGLFRPKDSEGNDIKLSSLVKLAGSEKKGRVLGFGDDGAGNMIIRVDWQFPIDMKFMEPREMGEKREKPEDLIIQNKKTNTMNELNENDMKKDGIINNVQDILSDYKMDIITSEEELQETINKMFDMNYNSVHEEIGFTGAEEGDAEELDESGRGLGAGVKNSGNRNVKLRDDHHKAPLTNINESINKSIKVLLETKVTKKALKEFIDEEAKKVSKNLKR